MRFRLRSKILLMAVMAPVALGLGALWLVDRRVSEHVRTTVDQSLASSARVCQKMLEARLGSHELSARVIAEDPRFFSTMTLAAASLDQHARATVQQVAHEFNRIARADLFEAFDLKGRLVASIGRDASPRDGRSQLLARARAGSAAGGLLAKRGALLQAIAVPVATGRRSVGTLLIGYRMGDQLATELRGLTRSEVTFLSGDEVTGSTLPPHMASSMASKALASERFDPSGRSIVEVKGGGDVFLTLARALPGDSGNLRAIYLLQRSLAEELFFLSLIQQELGELALMIVLVAVLVGLLVSLEITRPVGELVRAAEQMEHGNYDFPLEVRTHDEIGYLAARFREMRQREQGYVNTLEEVARQKSDFISLASHELRTPVTVIKAYAELIADGTLGLVTEDQRKALEVIEQNLRVIVHITEDAAAMAQLQGERPILRTNEVDIDPLIREAIGSACSEGAQRRLRVSAKLDPDLGCAVVDGPRLVRAVAHLVRNAIRFTPDGGSVSVSARREEPDLVIEVRDTGIGIDEAKQPHLFTRSIIMRDSLHHHSSSTLEFNSAGLGLGLSIARGIVEAHGGSISVSSRVGEGSVFTIRVPLGGVREALEAA